ncbi:hypothetical protein F5B20DRAFT_538088 [Whalleya microplaca]|nr:hypothetical protein F5B20DRAFT_538088 [Whalleya microplaca]
MAAQDHVFHLFPRLPAELRLIVWRECLPHRVVELERPLSQIVFFKQPKHCTVEATTNQNSCQPVISRVCRESRAVAFETGGGLWAHYPDEDNNHWEHYFAMRDPWFDTARDVVHMHYEEAYDVDFGHPNSGDPVRHVVWAAAQTKSGQASFNLDFLSPGYMYNQSQLADLLRLRSSWLVVVHIVVVHMDLEAAATSGLFGLLCDARVQIIDLRDKRRVDAFYDLALKNKRTTDPAGQPLDRASLASGITRLEDAVTDIYKEKPAPAMHAAVMFRLCTQRCDQEDQRGSHLAGAVRGRGGHGQRGRGMNRGRGALRVGS